MLQDPEVAAIAASNGRTVAQTLLRWGLQHGTSVIPKSSNPKHSQVRHTAEGTCFRLGGRQDLLGSTYLLWKICACVQPGRSRLCTAKGSSDYNTHFVLTAALDASKTMLVPITCCFVQDNQGAWGWSLSKEDYNALFSMNFQLKYFDGGFVMNTKGPYKTYEDLWNEPEP